jgi:hypothetical protein
MGRIRGEQSILTKIFGDATKKWAPELGTHWLDQGMGKELLIENPPRGVMYKSLIVRGKRKQECILWTGPISVNPCRDLTRREIIALS